MKTTVEQRNAWLLTEKIVAERNGLREGTYFGKVLADFADLERKCDILTTTNECHIAEIDASNKERDEARVQLAEHPGIVSSLKATIQLRSDGCDQLRAQLAIVTKERNDLLADANTWVERAAAWQVKAESTEVKLVAVTKALAQCDPTSNDGHQSYGCRFCKAMVGVDAWSKVETKHVDDCIWLKAKNQIAVLESRRNER